MVDGVSANTGRDGAGFGDREPVIRAGYASRDGETLHVSNHNGKASLFEEGDESDTRQWVSPQGRLIPEYRKRDANDYPTSRHNG